MKIDPQYKVAECSEAHAVAFSVDLSQMHRLSIGSNQIECSDVGKGCSRRNQLFYNCREIGAMHLSDNNNTVAITNGQDRPIDDRTLIPFL